VTVGARELQLVLRPEWDPAAADAAHQGLLARDPRARTLVRVLVSYPEVRYILPDRISLEASADPSLVESLERFLARQHWLLKGVVPR
jgi:hypothetical protein